MRNEKFVSKSFMQSGLTRKMSLKISGAMSCSDAKKYEDGDSLILTRKNTVKEIGHQENGLLMKTNGFKVEKLLERSSYFEADLKWMNVIGMTILHIVSLYILMILPYREKK